MTKTKLIGDTYIVAYGLFASDEEPQKHAKQSIDFTLCVLNILPTEPSCSPHLCGF